MNRSSVWAIVGSLIVFVLLSAHPAQALTFNVSCDPAALAASINTANTVPGANTLNLAAGCFYFYTNPDPVNAENALPLISNSLTINGNGAVISRSSGSNFRLMRVGQFVSLTINDLVMIGGNINGNGGGIYNEGSLTVNDGMFISNRGGTSGGGIYNTGTAIVTGTSFLNNSGTSSGGALHNAAGATASLIDCTLTGNGGSLGAALNNAGTLTVSQVTSTGSTASSGGALYNTGTATVYASTIAGNRVFGGGGGIFNTGTLTVMNTVISGNSSPGSGSSIESGGGSVTVGNSTIAGNFMEFDGGTVSHWSGAFTISNSILWGNAGITQIDGAPTVSYSVVQDGFAGTNVISSDPLFVAPQAPDETTAGDYRLQTGSAAINAGSNDLILLGATTDRDEVARIVNGTVDAGAYENQTVPSLELLDNGGFELHTANPKLPDGWTLKNGSSDKLTCDPGKPHAGLCAFAFKGGIGEKAQLSQIVDLNGVTFEEGNTLTLTAFFLAKNGAAKTKVTLSVTNTGSPTALASKTTVKQVAAYTQAGPPVFILSSGAVAQIKVTFKHVSSTGTVLIDDASLIRAQGSARTRSDAPLPPPSAPSGFRGSN